MMKRRFIMPAYPNENPPNHSVSCQRSEARTTRAAHNSPTPKASTDRAVCEALATWRAQRTLESGWRCLSTLGMTELFGIVEIDSVVLVIALVLVCGAKCTTGNISPTYGRIRL